MVHKVSASTINIYIRISSFRYQVEVELKPLDDGQLLLVLYVLCLFERLMKAENVLTRCRWCDSGCSAWCSV